MMKIYFKAILLLAFMALLDSCVSQSTFDAMVYSRDSVITLNDSLKDVIVDRNTNINGLNEQLDGSRQTITRLQSELINSKDNYEKLKSRASGETQDLLTRIEDLQAENIQTSSKLSRTENQLNDIKTKLAERDAKMDSLRASIEQALVGFEGKGFDIKIDDGKVYVSMSNQLLFSSGSTKIDTKGQEALLELAKVLNVNVDINILIEGHTDIKSVRSGKRFTDNWDLSVLRATEVVRFLEDEGEVDPVRMIASGRSKYFPLVEGEDKESLATNRRTEIILSPNLGNIFNVINN